MESKRVKVFRLGIIKAIPKFPNDKATLQTLNAFSLATLLIHYNNWVIRYVPPRLRTVSVESSVLLDPRWTQLSNEIEAFLDKVKGGENLIPHMSLEPYTRGYTPASAEKGPNVDRWSDKDFLLNVMGYHHFHLGSTILADGFVSRTKELLFARVSRDHFNIIAICDHSVFERSSNSLKAMTKEREKLWKVFEEHSSRGISPGTVYISSMITTSGHSMYLVRLADEYARIVKEIDPQTDDTEYIKGLFESVVVPFPKKPELKWHLNFLDLGLLETTSKSFFVFRYGPI